MRKKFLNFIFNIYINLILKIMAEFFFGRKQLLILSTPLIRPWEHRPLASHHKSSTGVPL
jgi:hypothetical protein